MGFCRDCSKPSKDDFWYCYDCNTKRKAEKTGACRTCNKAVKPSFKLCWDCRQKDMTYPVRNSPDFSGYLSSKSRDMVSDGVSADA